MTDSVAEETAEAEIRKGRFGEIFQFGPWTLTTKKSHILQSKCPTPTVCQDVQASSHSELCMLCRYEKELSIPKLPDMTFANNVLRIEHAEGYGIEFNCLDALRRVNKHDDLVKVAASDTWMQAVSDSGHSQNVINPFDWTFSTDYKGTLLLGNKEIKVVETTERIDVEKLKVREEIIFYDDVHLFEDELADNGVAQSSVKMRVMKSGFFVLMRYFLRVDNVKVKMNDTRLYYEVGKNYMLREYTSRESKIQDLKVPPSVLKEPAELWLHIPLKGYLYEKLELPS